jgi:glycosyltransferase involved in cell wall biosynthesis
MKIGIVAPSSVPFTLGGAERLWNGLTSAINDLTPHDAELIKLPSREHNLPDLVETYGAFSLLDLSHFDLVVSTKYPAWMVEHPNHVVYLQHTLRGLYDHYHLTGLPELTTYREPGLRELQALMRSGQGRAVLPEFFERFRHLLSEHGRDDPVFAFPGPLAREIVHFLDGIGLAPESVRRYLAISRTVAERRGYFPPGVVAEAVHHPSDLTGHRCGRFEYLFTASRLDGPKRLDLLVEAMRFVPPGVRLRIAGTGPDSDRLRAMAADDARIEFLGYVSSAQLIDLYADALAVPFIPLEEDLGLITLEAMSSGKPVVTCHDSGGPTELVIDGVNGFVTRPRAPELGAALARLAADPVTAPRLGEAARRTAEKVTWRRTVSTIIGWSPFHRAAQPPVTRHDRAVRSTFPIHPPTGGGQLRCFHLYRTLTARYDVEVVSLAPHTSPTRSTPIAPGMTETAIPKSAQHEASENRITAIVGGSVTDILASGLINQTPAYLEALDRALLGADGVVLAHPFLYPAVRSLRPKLPVIYDAHNAEFLLKQTVLPQSKVGQALLDLTREVEAAATRQAVLVSACSTEDLNVLRSTFAPANRFVVIPNGIDTAGLPFTSGDLRADRSRRWREQFLAGLPSPEPVNHTAVFVGSWHPPNNEAAGQIVELAEQVDDVLFLLMGSHCDFLRTHALPPNVVPLGVVSHAVKRQILESVDIALNPMLSGSGTNLKIVEYFAAGVPVVSTPLGARGLEVEPGRHLEVTPVDGFAAAIRAIVAEPGRAQSMARAARDLVEKRYDWDILGQAFLDAVVDALPPKTTTVANGVKNDPVLPTVSRRM